MQPIDSYSNELWLPKTTISKSPTADSAKDIAQPSFSQVLEDVKQSNSGAPLSPGMDKVTLSQAATAPDASVPEVTVVKGVEVIVAGHGFERSDTPGTKLEQIVYTPEMREQSDWEFELRSKGGTELATMIAPDEPLQGFGTITPISFLGYEMSPGEIMLSSDVNDIINYERQLLTNFMEQMETTKALEQDYGSDIKVGYDPKQQSYVMLRPGDNHYDNLVSSQEAHDYMKSTFDDEPKRYQYLGDILEKYNYRMT